MPGMAKTASLLGPSCPTLVIGHPSLGIASDGSLLLPWRDDKGEAFGLARLLMVSATVWKLTWDCLGLAGHFIILPRIESRSDS
jgi:hypothetical protein